MTRKPIYTAKEHTLPKTFLEKLLQEKFDGISIAI